MHLHHPCTLANWAHFNHLIKNLAKLCPDKVEEFTEAIHVSKEKYHNGDYEENEINKFLANVEKLEELLDEKLYSFIDGFNAISF